MLPIIGNQSLLGRKLAQALGVPSSANRISWAVHTDPARKPNHIEFRWPWQAHRFAFECVDAGYCAVILRVERDHAGRPITARTVAELCPPSA